MGAAPEVAASQARQRAQGRVAGGAQGAAGDTTHPAYGSEDQPFTHAHSHHVSGDRTHQHTHTHFGDAVHIGHDHSDLDRAAQSAEEAKQARHQQARRQPLRLMNSARRPGTDDPWERLAQSGREIEQQLKGRR